MMHWRAFWECFSSIMDLNSHLISQQKRAQLVKAMDCPVAKAEATRALSCTVTYDEAVARMRKIYEDKIQLHQFHVTQFFQQRPYKNTKADLRDSLSRCQEHVTGIKATEGYSAEQILATFVTTLLPPIINSKWKEKIGKMPAPPTLTQLEAFLEDVIYAANAPPITIASDPAPLPSASGPRKRILPKTPTRSALAVKRAMECRVCSGEHSVFGCDQFSNMTVAERLQWIEEAEVCINCLSATHSSTDCTSSNWCKVCQQPHHTLIHQGSEDVPAPELATCMVTQRPENTLYAHFDHTVSLTAVVRVRAKGITQQGRTHLDTGATVTLITREFANKLKVPKIAHSSSTITGISDTFQTLYKVKLRLLGSPKMGKGRQAVEVIAHIVEQIPAPCSSVDMTSVRTLPFVHKLPLADPQYTPGAKIDLLLEMAAITVASFRRTRYSQVSNLEARMTIFGWVIGGSHHPPQQSFHPTVCCVSKRSLSKPAQDDPDHLLSLFWETEPADNSLSIDLSNDDRAVAHFTATHKRDHTGRYSVSLPRVPNPPRLGASQAIAHRRFLANERSLARKGTLQPYQMAV